MADNKSDIDPIKVEAISLDDWVVTPVSLDEWVVDEAEEKDSSSETAAVAEVDVTAETLVVPPQPIKVEQANEIENIDLDDWVLDDEEKSETKHLQVDISDEELEGSIEVDDQTFAESGSFPKDSLSIDNKTQVMDVGLQGDLAELEETNLEEISIEPKTETDDQTEGNEEEDEDDLLSDIDGGNMHLNDDPFEPEEPVPSVGTLEAPPTSNEKVELNIDAETTIEDTEIEENSEISLDTGDSLPAVENQSDLEFPPTSMQKVELDFSSETAVEEMAAAKVEEAQDQEQESDDDLDIVESSVDLDLEDDSAGIEIDLEPLEGDSDDLDLPESKIDYLDEDDDSNDVIPPSLPAADLEPNEIQPVQLTESDLVATHTQSVQLTEQDLAEQHWVRLTKMDLAESHQLGVVRLQESQLRENNTLPVVRLHEHDYATNHRKVIELDPHFFDDHDIERDVQGVILLKADDLVDPSVLEEEDSVAPKERRRKKVKETKESYFTNARIVKICALVILFCMIAIPVRMHFKYSWVTVSQKRYDEIKTQTSGIDWVTTTMFKYRTKDSFWRWYGLRKLNSRAYTKASDSGATMWLFYDQGRNGDDYP
jgi:hypothetical protein